MSLLLLFQGAAAGGGVTGTSAITLNAVTSAAVGAAGASGTSAVILNSVAVSAAGAETFTATSAVTLNAVTTSATGAAGASGTSAIALNPVAMAGAGIETFTATSAIALNAITAAATGAAGASGTSAIDLAGITFAGQGTHTDSSVVVGAPSYGGYPDQDHGGHFAKRWRRAAERLLALERELRDATTELAQEPTEETLAEAEKLVERASPPPAIQREAAENLGPLLENIAAARDELERTIAAVEKDRRRRINNQWLMMH